MNSKYQNPTNFKRAFKRLSKAWLNEYLSLGASFEFLKLFQGPFFKFDYKWNNIGDKYYKTIEEASLLIDLNIAFKFAHYAMEPGPGLTDVEAYTKNTLRELKVLLDEFFGITPIDSIKRNYLGWLNHMASFKKRFDPTSRSSTEELKKIYLEAYGEKGLEGFERDLLPLLIKAEQSMSED